MVLIDCKISVLNGVVMTGGILGSTFVLKKIDKKLAPNLTTKSALSLGTVVILAQLTRDWLINRGTFSIDLNA